MLKNDKVYQLKRMINYQKKGFIINATPIKNQYVAIKIKKNGIEEKHALYLSDELEKILLMSS